MLFSAKQLFDQHRESTAITILKKLQKKGISIDQIQSEHITLTYRNLNRLTSAPDFKSIEGILPNKDSGAIYKSEALWGVIVETRKHPAIEIVINSFIERTGIPIQLFHGKNNLDFIMATNISQLVQKGKIHLTQLNIDNLDSNKYNALLLSKRFWENVICKNKLLIFQTDTIACNSSNYVLQDFISYDYIGSKWNRARPVGIIIDGGNGGLSLRDWKKTYDCLDRFPPEHWYGGEDGYFAFHIELIGGKVAGIHECAKFSTQYEFLYNSFGAHQISCLNKKKKIAFLEYCPEARFMLIK